MPRFLSLPIVFLLGPFAFSPLAFGQNDCQKALPELEDFYKSNGQPLISHEIKECPRLVRDIRGSSRRVYETSACAIFLYWDPAGSPDLAVFDGPNDFELSMGFGDGADASYSKYLLGDLVSGSLTMTKSQDKQMTQASYDLRSDELKLFKWKPGFFSDRYSHSYTVSCR